MSRPTRAAHNHKREEHTMSRPPKAYLAPGSICCYSARRALPQQLHLSRTHQRARVLS
jgi:hypothetical protein